MLWDSFLLAIFYGFDHGKPPFFTTIWGIFLTFSKHRTSKSKFLGVWSQLFLRGKIGISNERNDSHGKRGTISFQKKGILAVRNSRVLIVDLLDRSWCFWSWTNRIHGDMVYFEESRHQHIGLRPRNWPSICTVSQCLSRTQSTRMFK